MFEKCLRYLATLKSSNSQEMHYCNVVGRKSVSLFCSSLKIFVSFTKWKSRILALSLLLQIKAAYIIKGVNVTLISCTVKQFLSLFHISSYRAISIFKNRILLKYIRRFKVNETKSIYWPSIILILFKVINCFFYIFLYTQAKKIYQTHVVVRFHVLFINFKSLFEWQSSFFEVPLYPLGPMQVLHT